MGIMFICGMILQCDGTLKQKTKKPYICTRNGRSDTHYHTCTCI